MCVSLSYIRSLVWYFRWQSVDRSLFENHRLFPSAIEAIITSSALRLWEKVFRLVENYVELWKTNQWSENSGTEKTINLNTLDTWRSIYILNNLHRKFESLSFVPIQNDFKFVHCCKKYNRIERRLVEWEKWQIFRSVFVCVSLTLVFCLRPSLCWNSLINANVYEVIQIETNN